MLFLFLLARTALSATLVHAQDSILPGPGDVKPLDQCPGYRAANVTITDTGLSADLELAGDICGTYGEDIRNLQLEVEYQTSTPSFQLRGDKLTEIKTVEFM